MPAAIGDYRKMRCIPTIRIMIMKPANRAVIAAAAAAPSLDACATVIPDQQEARRIVG